MYLVHFSLSTVLQNAVMPLTSSLLHFGFRMNSHAISSQLGYMQSGDSERGGGGGGGGVAKDFAILDVCLGSLLHN